MDLRPLSLDHLGYRTEEERELDADWFIAHMADYLQYHPEGCFTLFDDDRPIGMITGIPYQTIGWLGWLYVLESQRKGGLGAELTKAGIEHLRSVGMKTVILEAVVEAVPLYKRLGFVEQFLTQHYLLSSEGRTFATADDVEVSPAAPEQLDEIMSFDFRFFGQDRRRMFEIAMRNRGFEGFVARRKGRTAGYLFLTEGSADRQVSPMLVLPAADHDGAVTRTLFAAAFERATKPLYFRCPQVYRERSRRLEECGATKVDYHTVRMFLGQEYVVEREGVLSLGCPGKG